MPSINHAELEDLRRKIVERNLNRLAKRNRAKMDSLGLEERDVAVKIAEYRTNGAGVRCVGLLQIPKISIQ